MCHTVQSLWEGRKSNLVFWSAGLLWPSLICLHSCWIKASMAEVFSPHAICKKHLMQGSAGLQCTNHVVICFGYLPGRNTWLLRCYFAFHFQSTFARKYPAHWLNWLKSQLFHFSFLRSIVVGHQQLVDMGCLPCKRRPCPSASEIWEQFSIVFSYHSPDDRWFLKAWPSEKVPSAKPFLHAVKHCRRCQRSFFNFQWTRWGAQGMCFFFQRNSWLIMTRVLSGWPKMKQQDTCRLLSAISTLTYLYPSVSLIVSHCKLLLVAEL